MVWGKLPDGNSVPLDPKPPVYSAVTTEDGKVLATRLMNGYVSHFATCPKANDFSASKKTAPTSVDAKE